MYDLIKFWAPIIIVIIIFLLIISTAINAIKNKQYMASKGREAILMGILFAVIAFSLGILTIKVYLTEGISGIISLGTHVLNRR